MIVQTKNGKIRGFDNVSIIGEKLFYSFLGVPYAKPPVGDLRFSAPEPLEDWQDVYDATYERDVCAQIDLKTDTKITGSDDCLYLNIHTPEMNSKSLKPVLFYLHSGGFIGGSGTAEIHGPHYLMEHDVVLVSINYRLNILGFLNLGIPECTGNAGLKDQIAALKWVKENIAAFGGDPNNITIDGCSAGGSSVHFLMISPLASGLFQRAISQCGTALSSWAITHDPIKWAFKAGRKLGFMGEDSLDLLKFLRTIPADKLTEAATALMGDIQKEFPARALYVPFSPSVEAFKEGAFLPDSPENLSKTATPLECIFGHSEVEPIYIGNYLRENIPKDPKSVLLEVIKSNFSGTDEQLLKVEQKVREFYFEQNDAHKSDLEKLYEFLTDIITLPVYDSFEFVIKSNVPVYVYYFTHYTENTSFKKIYQEGFLPFIKKGYHSEEQNFFLSTTFCGTKLHRDGTDGEVRKKITKLWANFVKSGNPSSDDVKWEPSTKDQPCYLQLDADFKLRKGQINENRIKFLKNIVQNVELIK